MRGFGAILGYALVFASCLRGQVRPPAATTLWVSGTRGAAIETRQGVHHDRGLTALGLRGAWPVLERDDLTLEYVADLIPVVVTTANRAYRTPTAPCTPPDCTASTYGEDGSLAAGLEAQRYTAVGFGVAPLGAQLRLSIASRIKLTAAASGGALYFSRPVPDYKAARLNFTGEIGAGVELAFRDKRALALGYRFQHISNGGRAPVNVGLDSHLLAIGLVFPR